MQKRGQVTIFIILGALLLMGVGISIYYNSIYLDNAKVPVKKMDQHKFSVKVQTNYCLQTALEQALYFVGPQGGFFYPTSKWEAVQGVKVPYYYYKGEANLPTKDELEEELGRAVKDKIVSCLDNMVSVFSIQGVNLTYSLQKVNPRISKSKVILETVIPIRISQADESLVDLGKLSDSTTLTELSNFDLNLNFQYGAMYDWSKQIVQIQAKNPEGFPISQIADLAFRENFTFDIISVETQVGESVELETTELVEVEDDRNKVLIALSSDKVYSKPYYFTFGLMYDIDYEQFFAEVLKIEKEMAALEAELNLSG